MPQLSIQKVVVIGAGVIGCQIAAHLTNASVDVLLLDVVPAGVTDRNCVAKAALERMAHAKPSPYMLARNARLLTIGNIEDDLGKLKQADWIIEAVTENAATKAALYEQIDAVKRPGAIVSSGTSTIPLGVLVSGQSEQFVRDFMITHFFNPARQMRLVELISGPQTRREAVELIRDFCDRRLGKSVIMARDTPGFVANRIGMFFQQAALNAAFDLDLGVTDVDAACGEPLGLPHRSVFGLIDLGGLDLFLLKAKILKANLSVNDKFTAIYRDHSLLGKMIKEGLNGRKGKGGFYCKRQTLAGPVREVINLKTGCYEPLSPTKAKPGQTNKSLRSLCDTSTPSGALVWEVLSQTLAYAALVAPQISDNIHIIDEALRNGFNWRYGPFELLDIIGVDWFMARLREEQKPLPAFLLKAAGRGFYRESEGYLEYLNYEGAYEPVKRPEGVLLLADVKRASEPVVRNDAASLWDIGDGVFCVEFHTKYNAIEPDTLALILQAIKVTASSGRGLVFYNENGNFSIGANLEVMLLAAKAKDWQSIAVFLKQGREVFRALRFASFPTVMAVSGYVLSGGCELVQHAAAVQAHADAMMGLAEAKSGIIPSWGGCSQLLGHVTAARKQFGGDIPPVNHVFEVVSQSKISRSAMEARDMQFLRQTDGITMNRERLLFDAKQRVLELAKGYHPPGLWKHNYSGATGRAALELVMEGYKLSKHLTEHDLQVCRALANVLCGGETDIAGPVTEEKFAFVEQREFMELIQLPETLSCIERMLDISRF